MSEKFNLILTQLFIGIQIYLGFLFSTYFTVSSTMGAPGRIQQSGVSLIKEHSCRNALDRSRHLQEHSQRV